MHWFRNTTISRKLVVVMMLTSCVALLLAATGFTAHQVLSFRRLMTERLSSLADVIGANSAGALAFEDRAAAERIVSSVEGQSYIVAACLYTQEGLRLAAFRRANAAACPADAESFAKAEDGFLVLLSRVTYLGEPVGSIGLMANRQELWANLRQEALIISALLIFALGAAWGLASYLQHLISDPILHLVGVAKTVKQESDYSVRAERGRDDELGLLSNTFNDMLDQIETHVELLVQAQKMEGIGQMAGGIAHDFNNILTAIVGYSEVVLTQIDESDPIWHDIHEIRKAGTRAAALTSQLLAFSRKQVLKVTVVDLNAVVRDVEKMLQRLLGEDIAINTDLAGDLRHIKADANQLEQILVNLAVNARDAMSQGGKLTIATANVELELADFVLPAGRYTRLVVSDTGCGMDEHIRARIFEPFFTTKETGKGTGLGLSTIYGTVKQLGGHVLVSSEPRQGTSFTIYLPQTDECLEPLSTRADASIPVGEETVLLVEDDQAVRALTAKILRRAGYSLREAATPEEALAISACAHVPISLVLTDVVMPGMNGKQMVERLLANRPDVKVIYMSGYSEDFFGRSLLDGADDVLLQKPFAADALLLKMRQVLDAGVVAANEALDHSPVSGRARHSGGRLDRRTA